MVQTLPRAAAKPWVAPATHSRSYGAAVALGLALVIAALLRFLGLTRIPPGLQQDEAMNGLDAYSIGLTGRDHFGHPFPIAGLESFGDWVSPLLTLLSAPVIALTGPRVDALRAVAACVGLLGIPAIYWCARMLFGRRDLALLAAWLLALSTAHVHLSRFAIPPVTVPTLVPLLLAVALAALRHRCELALAAAGASAGVVVLGYPTMKLYVPLALLAVAAIEWRAVRDAPPWGLVAAAVSFAAIAGPNLFLSIADPGGRTRLSQISTLDQSDGGLLDLIAGYIAYFNPLYLFGSGDGNCTHGFPLTGLLLWSLAPLLLIGFARLLALVRQPGEGRYRRGAAVLLAAFFLAPIPGALTVPSPHTLRGSPLIPLGLLICALGATPLLDLLQRQRRPRSWRGFGAIAAVIILLALPFIESASRLERYYREYPAIGASQFSAGIAEVTAWVAPRASEYDEVWLPFPYNYYLFYQAVPPSEIHVSLEVRRTTGRFNQIRAYGRYRFEMPLTNLTGFTPQTTIHGPDGVARYEIGPATAGDGRRLLVARPIGPTAPRAP
jgi:4-amino-4-deoxy-L-arabinose transferase-like glycosyltransferase